ncbi:hypothetical protein AMELA_G00293140 [Ameiurus melas]|uniref:Uncharacterized protein n=1 Tax=Ameiurus melas TaxID=219545 RepID=A0A7J5ZII6_AMEME|nr:hypothetical protein AMELA_G00293140 [Ameiurus melas]
MDATGAGHNCGLPYTLSGPLTQTILVLALSTSSTSSRGTSTFLLAYRAAAVVIVSCWRLASISCCSTESIFLF